MNEIINTVRQITATDFQIIFKPAIKFGVPVNILDITRLRSNLGWQPQTSLEEGIKQTVAWLKDTI